MEIVLLTHGEWGAELVKSAELIVGPLKNVKCFPLHPDCPLKEYVRETQAYIEQRKGVSSDYRYSRRFYLLYSRNIEQNRKDSGCQRTQYGYADIGR